MNVTNSQAVALLAACKVVSKDLDVPITEAILWLSTLGEKPRVGGNALVQYCYDFWFNRDPKRLISVGVILIDKEGNKNYKLYSAVIFHNEKPERYVECYYTFPDGENPEIAKDPLSIKLN